ncbi:2-oxoglutarate and iron-dependent oxygenase domain-containing protein [Streptomyces sp. CLV115]|uniref:isopenicillin N synthase family dioxygenase n=1 Tax=Streptomyces sp. CLV115 TaxID=3138502 RepID=UPI00313B5B8D
MQKRRQLARDDVRASVAEIPLIDFSGFLDGDAHSRQQVADQIGLACRTAGFFYLVNHGISADTSASAFDCMHWMFALDADEKQKLRRTSKSPRGYYHASEVYTNASSVTRESFVIMADPDAGEIARHDGHAAFGSNRWPAGRTDVAANLMAYFSAASSVSNQLIEAFAATLHLPVDRIQGNYQRPLSNLQLNHYPGQPSNGNKPIGLPPHRDTGGFTLLMTDDIAGLQVKGPEDQWIDAPVVPGSLIVNVANMLEMQTNGVFKSVVHRVVNRGSETRYSLPFFVNPGWSARIFPEPEFITDENPSRYSSPLEFGPWYYNILYGSKSNDRADIETEILT